MARLEATNAGISKTVMLNANGYVTEGTADNIFIVKNNMVYTSPCYAGILKGITRDTVINILKESGLKLKEELFTPFKVYTADECYITGTAVGLASIVNLDGREVADGKPGLVASMARKKLEELMAQEGT